ncbi:MAG TPA: protein kinase, partial [Candidatus Baltobacteraceae bacterium]|nr:protein kinase [Candidatus Baltobacteraceae bacterium]
MIEQQTFNNRYRLDSKLGEGGMATVYCGTDTVLRRRVAIKVLRPQYAADDEFVRRFYQEAESAARLSHPNIVNTYDVGREGDTYYIVMELVDGPSLAEVIAADGKLPEPVAIDYAAQICNGLAYAHRAGLLHRDVKPANILVTKDDVVKLSDFGIARAVSQHTMTLTKPGLVMGSVYYISPEQAQGHDLHESSDLYSVGIVLYQ